MTDFYSLASHERTLAMLLAYFYDYKESKSAILEMEAKMMSPSLASNAFHELVRKDLVKDERKYYNGGPLEYMLRSELVFPALSGLFEPENFPLLKSIRGAFKRQHNINKPSYSVRQMISLISPNQAESRVMYIAGMNPLSDEICMLMDNPRYERIFNSMSDFVFAPLLRDKMLKAICRNEDIDWEYTKEVVFFRRAGKSNADSLQIFQSMFAFFCFLATGNVCIDLQSFAANLFTLQIVAIRELYKGNYEQAYKLYTKAMV